MVRKLFLIAIMLGLAHTAVAQDFRKVIDIVGEMEVTLKQMISREEQQRKGEIASLRQEVAELRTVMAQPSAGMTATGIEPLSLRVEALEQRVSGISTGPELAVLTGQLSTLVAELRKTIDDTRLKPPAPAPPAESFPSVKVGLLAQFHAQALQEQTTAAQDADASYNRHWQRQMYIRRFRVLVGGNLSKNTTYFFESDATNIGRVANSGSKTNGVSMYVQDAQLQHTFAPELSLIAGLQLVGISRNGLQSAASLMALNYGTYQFVASGPLDNSVGRDLGLSARGFLADERFEYRAGLYSGRNFNAYSPLRGAFRLQYCFLDREKGFYYTGTTLGKGQILSFGAGLDMQGSYRAISVDGMTDVPAGSLGSMTLSTSLGFFNGGGSDEDSTAFTGLVPKQTIFFLEAGYFFRDIGLQPYVKYESQSVSANVLKQVAATPATLDYQNLLRSSTRWGVGVNYYMNGHNASIKLLYEIVSRNRASGTAGVAERATNGEASLQIQYFTF